MISSKANRLSGVVLIWLAWATAAFGQSPLPTRLPPCRPLDLEAPILRRTPTVIQVTSLEAVDDQTEPPAAWAPQTWSADLPKPAPLPIPSWVPSEQAPIGGLCLDEYVIQSGDELEVRFRSTPVLNEAVTVRPDGMITLQVVGDILAAGRTPEELRYFLVEAFRNTLQDPVIVVQLKKFAANDVFVGGEVFFPGRIPISGQMSVLQAIILAGGFKDTANQKRVIVRHADGFSQEVNLKAEIKGRMVGQDILLRPYDVVFVPKSRIAKVNLFVEQYIENVLPFSRNAGIFVTRELNSQNVTP